MSFLFERCSDALIQTAKQRNTSLRAAMDLIPGSLLTDCFREYAHQPQVCGANGYATGGAQQQSGVGTLRRIMDVEKFLKDVAAYSDRKYPKKAA
jgi:hypothetical protein